METITKKLFWQPQAMTPAMTIIQCDIATFRRAHNNELTDIDGHKDCSLRSLSYTELNCYRNMVTPGKNFREDI